MYVLKGLDEFVRTLGKLLEAIEARAVACCQRATPHSRSARPLYPSGHSDGRGPRARANGARSRRLASGNTRRVRFPLRNDSASTAPPSERAQSEPPQARAPKRRVLVVDDNADGAELLELALQTLGHDTRVAHDGPEALAAAKDFLPDVALLDIGLPGMNGYELARAMRDLLGDSTPVLVAVTGYGQDSDRKQSSAAGFAHHLVKPIDLQGVGALIASLKVRSA